MLPVVWSVRHVRCTNWLSHTVSTPNCGDDMMVIFVDKTTSREKGTHGSTLHS